MASLFLWCLRRDIWEHIEVYGLKEISVYKIRKKLSKKLLCDVSIHLIELNVSVDGALWHHCFCGVQEGIFGSALMLMMEKEISSYKN